MKKYGLLGKKLVHSLSPPIHNSIFSNTELSGSYDLFPIPKDELSIYINKLRARELKGLNVTIPYKQDVAEFLDEISPEAKRIGSINTICMVDGKLTGNNTDYFGVIKTLELTGISLKNKSVAILGSGGTARCLVFAAMDSGASSITIVSRNPENNPFPQHKIVNYEDYLNKKSQILINSTPVGMFPKMDFSPLTKGQVAGHEAVIDVIYNPTETTLLKYARELNLPRANGLYMLIAQAVKAQEIFNSTSLPLELIDTIYEELKDYQL